MRNGAEYLPGNEISLAVKLGGPDPSFNVRLGAALNAAKKANLTKANIDQAVARALGRGTEGRELDNILYEVMVGPTALLMYRTKADINHLHRSETLTDKRTRTIATIKNILKKSGGVLAPSAFLFEKKGRIVVKPDVTVDEMLEIAVEAGAEDMEELADGEGFELTTTVPTLGSVAKKLKEVQGYDLLAAEISYIPNEDTMVDLDENGEQARELGNIIYALEDDPDVTRVITNAR